MTKTPTAFAEFQQGDRLGPLRLTIGPDANARYFTNAGVEHPALRAGALYPPIVANLSVLLFGLHCDDEVIQARQRLRCHRIQPAGTPLVITGHIADRITKRGRLFLDIAIEVATEDAPDDPFWESIVSFTPA